MIPNAWTQKPNIKPDKSRRSSKIKFGTDEEGSPRPTEARTNVSYATASATGAVPSTTAAATTTTANGKLKFGFDEGVDVEKNATGVKKENVKPSAKPATKHLFDDIQRVRSAPPNIVEQSSPFYFKNFNPSAQSFQPTTQYSFPMQQVPYQYYMMGGVPGVPGVPVSIPQGVVPGVPVPGVPPATAIPATGGAPVTTGIAPQQQQQQQQSQQQQKPLTSQQQKPQTPQAIPIVAPAAVSTPVEIVKPKKIQLTLVDPNTGKPIDLKSVVKGSGAGDKKEEIAVKKEADKKEEIAVKKEADKKEEVAVKKEEVEVEKKVEKEGAARKEEEVAKKVDISSATKVSVPAIATESDKKEIPPATAAPIAATTSFSEKLEITLEEEEEEEGEIGELSINNPPPLVNNKRVYSKEFLLLFKELCLNRPSDLPQIEAIVGEESMVRRRQTQVPSNRRQTSSGGSLAKRHSSNPRMKRGGPRVKLEKSENRWVPYHERQESLSSVELLSRQLLNKLTVEKFEIITKKIVELEIDSIQELDTLCSLIHEKAIMESKFSEMYGRLSLALCNHLPEFKNVDESLPEEYREKRPAFRKLLLLKCQREFEIDSEDKKRSLGNIRFIGELYKVGLLSEKITHQCVQRLLNRKEEDELECCCDLLSTVGGKLDKSEASELFKVYFDRLDKMSRDTTLSSRLRFKIMDLIEKRGRGWKEREVQAKLNAGPMRLKDVEKAMDISTGGPSGGRKGSSSGGGQQQQSSRQHKSIKKKDSQSGTSVPAAAVTQQQDTININDYISKHLAKDFLSLLKESKSPYIDLITTINSMDSGKYKDIVTKLSQEMSQYQLKMNIGVKLGELYIEISRFYDEFKTVFRDMLIQMPEDNIDMPGLDKMYVDVVRVLVKGGVIDRKFVEECIEEYKNVFMDESERKEFKAVLEGLDK